jgi:hypothetical protein
VTVTDIICTSTVGANWARLKDEIKKRETCSSHKCGDKLHCCSGEVAAVESDGRYIPSYTAGIIPLYSVACTNLPTERPQI